MEFDRDYLDFDNYYVKENVCAFTGHRPESFSFGTNESSPECLRIKRRLKEEILKMAKNGVDTFITGMARGVDMWAAAAVLELSRQFIDIRLIAAIPYVNQPRPWSDAEKERYGRIIDNSTAIVLRQDYCRGCLLYRNRYMVDNSAHLIAVYNGSGKGGTAYTVDYARKRGRDIVIIDV